MAGNENSGGYRPDAPQNNPANINGLGGNGQSGMSINYTGFGYGENKAVNEQRKAAPMPTASSPAPAAPAPMGGMGGGIRDLFSPTMNDAEPVTAGAPVGPGPNDLALPPAFRSNARRLENEEIANKYLPFLIAGTQISGAPDSYKQFVSYVEGMLWPSRG